MTSVWDQSRCSSRGVRLRGYPPLTLLGGGVFRGLVVDFVRLGSGVWSLRSEVDAGPGAKADWDGDKRFPADPGDLPKGKRKEGETRGDFKGVSGSRSPRLWSYSGRAVYVTLLQRSIKGGVSCFPPPPDSLLLPPPRRSHVVSVRVEAPGRRPYLQFQAFLQEKGVTSSVWS